MFNISVLRLPTNPRSGQVADSLQPGHNINIWISVSPPAPPRLWHICEAVLLSLIYVNDRARGMENGLELHGEKVVQVCDRCWRFKVIIGSPRLFITGSGYQLDSSNPQLSPRYSLLKYTCTLSTQKFTLGYPERYRSLVRKPCK